MQAPVRNGHRFGPSNTSDSRWVLGKTDVNDRVFRPRSGEERGMSGGAGLGDPAGRRRGPTDWNHGRSACAAYDKGAEVEVALLQHAQGTEQCHLACPALRGRGPDLSRKGERGECSYET